MGHAWVITGIDGIFMKYALPAGTIYLPVWREI
jgi:hypothetical protein